MLLTVYLITAIIRLQANFFTELTPGVDGMYYPLQVRHFLDTFQLGFPDMPLTFWLEALLAKLINLFSNQSLDTDIINACKLTDSLIPPLAVVPVFLLLNKIFENIKVNRIFSFIILCFAVFTPSILVILVTDFHKEALGIVFVFTAIYFIYNYLCHKTSGFLYLSIISVLLTALTHFGCFSILLLFIFILTAIIVLKDFAKIKEQLKNNPKNILLYIILLLIFFILLLLVYHSDSQRFSRLLSFFKNPFSLFENSVIYFLLINKPVFNDPIRLIYFIIINLFSLYSILVFFKIRKQLNAGENIFITGVVIWLFLITNPFLGTEWAERVFFHFFIPFTVILIFAFRYVTRKSAVIASVFLYLFIFLSVFSSITPRFSFISKPELSELTSFKYKIHSGNKTLIITKHGLEWWAGWVLRTNIGLESGLKQGDWEKYSDIYILKHKNTKQSTLISSITGDVTIPVNSIKVIQGQHFDLFKMQP